MKLHVSLVLALILSVVCHPPLHACKEPSQVLKNFDADGDGKLNQTEAAAFFKAPRDQGKITEVHRAEIRLEMVRQHDGNGDGDLDPTERSACDKSVSEKIRTLCQQDKDRRCIRQKVALLRKYDANGNCKLEASELAAFREECQSIFAMPGHLTGEAGKGDFLDRYDLNKNGRLDPSELAACQNDAGWVWVHPGSAGWMGNQLRCLTQAAEIFNKWDANRDCRINDVELAVCLGSLVALREEEKAQAAARRAALEAKLLKEKARAAAQRAALEARLLKEYDQNGNGKLDPEEWKAYNEKQRLEAEARAAAKKAALEAKLLKEYDQNSNGKLDQEEWKAYDEKQAANAAAARKQSEADRAKRDAAAAAECARHIARKTELIALCDRDHDGKVTAAEIEVVRTEWESQQAAEKAPPPAPPVAETKPLPPPPAAVKKPDEPPQDSKKKTPASDEAPTDTERTGTAISRPL